MTFPIVVKHPFFYRYWLPFVRLKLRLSYKYFYSFHFKHYVKQAICTRPALMISTITRLDAIGCRLLTVKNVPAIKLLSLFAQPTTPPN
jgi:hypothetical protein